MLGKFGSALGGAFGRVGKGMRQNMGAGAGLGMGQSGGPINTGPQMGGGGDEDYGRGGKKGAAISGALGAIAGKWGDPQINGPARQLTGNMHKPFQMNAPPIPQMPQMQAGIGQGQMPGQQMPLPQVPPIGGGPVDTGMSPEMMPGMMTPPGMGMGGGMPQGIRAPGGYGGYRGMFGGGQQDPRFRF